MKILLLGDLHGIAPWYRWVTAEVQQFDLVCIPGDLIDMFRRSDEQIQFVRDEWLPAFSATGVPLAVCSGNHDHSISVWLSHLSGENLVADGVSCLLELRDGEKVIVTTCPYFGSFNALFPATAKLWMDGERLKKNNRGAPWLVLHHEPPPRLSPEAVINTLEKLTWRFTPDYVSCGHSHEGPEVLGRFAVTVRSTVFFNAGANFDALIPNHVVLDLAAGTAEWHRTIEDDTYYAVTLQL